MNSAFPNKKNLAHESKFIYENKFESNFLQKFDVNSTGRRRLYLEQPGRHFCQYFMRRTTQQTFLAINLAFKQKKTKLYFSSQVRRQFKLLMVPFKPYIMLLFAKLYWPTADRRVPGYDPRNNCGHISLPFPFSSLSKVVNWVQ